jgi:hypothetical protein
VKRVIQASPTTPFAKLRIMTTLLCWGISVCSAVAEEQTAPSKEQASAKSPVESDKGARHQRFLKEAREFCRSTQICVSRENDPSNDESGAALLADPVMLYSDEPRYIPDAALWIWTKGGRPFALQKVEVNNFNKTPLWTICFTSLSEDLVTVRWPNVDTFKATAPGWDFKLVPNVDAPAARAASRSIQLRAMARRFSGRVVSFLNGDSVELRLMPKPIFEYSDSTTKLPVGAIFGLASNGTNPTLLIAVEARTGPNGQLRWEHAHSRMTSEGGHLKLDDTVIWEFDPKPPPPQDVDNWTYIFVPHD